MNKIYPAGGWLAPGTPISWQREDQGQDFVIPWRGVLQAPGAGYVVAIGVNTPFPNGFGPHYARVRITTGRWAGHEWYLGHCTALVSAGQKFTFGTPLARADQGHPSQIGIVLSRPPGDGGWVELGQVLPSGIFGPNQTGHWYRTFFQNLIVKVPDPVYKFGSKGWNVLKFTTWLWRTGYIKRPYFRFNSQVHGAVIKFQKTHNIKADGVVGPVTWLAIQHAYKHKTGKK